METEKLTLKERMTKLRSQYEDVLPLGGYVMVMIDGRSFSKLIKNKYEKPFDKRFIGYMDDVAAYICKNVANCRFAYVQSDEITFVIDNPIKTSSGEEATPFFGNRTCKILSVIPSMASARFNQLVYADIAENTDTVDIAAKIRETKPVEFDCKAWRAADFNDVFAYLLWRQIDCVRNSKQQTAQTYLPHKQLLGLDTDTQITKLKTEKGIDWNEFEDNVKYGRFIYKETEPFFNEKMNVSYERSVWKSHGAFDLTIPFTSRAKIEEIINGQV